MDLFCFASRNEENIWLGYRARKWAVATVSSSQMQGRITKARKYLKVGSRGLLYCKPTQAFTVPFIVESPADPHKIVTDIWPEPWVLPFTIKPLGDPSKKVHAELAKLRWPYLQKRPHMHGGVTAAMNATGVTTFVPIDISSEDWKIILDDLATDGAKES
jgi:hypothetical protein